MNMPTGPMNDSRKEPSPDKKPFKVALLAPGDEEREELCDALQANSIGHELLIFRDADQFFEVIDSVSAGRNIDHALLPNLLMIAQAGESVACADILARVKRTPVIKAIPVIVFSPHDMASNTPQLYQLGAASVIRMPLRFDGLVKIVQVMEDYWFNVASPPNM
ncbi:hypothetical protein ACQUWM_06745 [Marinobacter sp. DUT-3]|uniref:hypothetical protein n=1 Tax=Marinobacter sp. DUT-3 TaxID=3412036 RepID=UPI003D16B299